MALFRCFFARTQPSLLTRQTEARHRSLHHPRQVDRAARGIGQVRRRRRLIAPTLRRPTPATVARIFAEYGAFPIVADNNSSEEESNTIFPQRWVTMQNYI